MGYRSCIYVGRLHALPPEETLRESVDRAYRVLDLPGCTWDNSSECSSLLPIPGGDTLKLWWGMAPDPPTLYGGFSQHFPPKFDEEVVSKVLAQVSFETSVVLGRTTLDGNTGRPREEEFNGDLGSVQWFQFLGPAAASRWPQAYLQAGPFQSVRSFPDGSVAIALAGSPFQFEGGEEMVSYLRSARKPHNLTSDL